MKRKLVADTGCDIFEMQDVDYTYCPMTLSLDGKEYVDSPDISIPDFVQEMAQAKVSRSACPGTGLWLSAFEEADESYAVTISSKLSGSYNAAVTAADTCIEENEEKKVLVVDSKSAGPHERLITEKLASLIQTDLSMEEIEKEIQHYVDHTHILFCLQSFSNFAKNGRISPAVAKIASTLGIKVIAADNREGEIKVAHKVHGNRKVISTILKEMIKQGYSGQRVIIGDCENPSMTAAMKEAILQEFPDADVLTERMSILCAFYAENGGMLVGYEDAGVNE